MGAQHGDPRSDRTRNQHRFARPRERTDAPGDVDLRNRNLGCGGTESDVVRGAERMDVRSEDEHPRRERDGRSDDDDIVRPPDSDALGGPRSPPGERREEAPGARKRHSGERCVII